MINIRNIIDGECLKWCLVRYLNPTDHYPARIIKADKDLIAKKLNFNNIKSPVKYSDIHKIEKKELHRH